MLARYYGASVGRFLGVDPSRDSIQMADPQSWNRFPYVLNNPVNRVDPDGEQSYLVARNGPLWSSHMFIVTHARYIGDPKAKVYSFGESSKELSKGKLGRVNTETEGLSEGTYQTDRSIWDSLNTKNPEKGVDFTPINAKDGKVASIAEAVVENKKYSMVGPNSNSAAQAIADRAEGAPVDTPEEFDPAVGAGDSGDIEFDEAQIKQDEAAGKHAVHVPAQKAPVP